MKILHAIVLFATIGLALAKEFFISIGLQTDYSMIGALGLAFTTFLIFRGLFAILGVAILCLLVIINPVFLDAWHIDRDMLMAAALTIILFPWINKIVKDS